MSADSDQSWTLLGMLQWTTEYFRSKGAESPRLEAELLLAHVLGISRIALYVQYERPMEREERERYREVVRRRGAGEPVAYILGSREFWSIDFQVGPGILVPRPDTETLVTRALEIAKEIRPSGEGELRIAEVGTGSGCISVALASELAEAQIWAGDIAPEPLRIAPQNAFNAGVGERVRVLEADGLRPLWEAAGQAPFDLVVTNPPYLRNDEFPHLMRDVRDYEPRVALTAGANGLAVIGPVVDESARPGVLAAGGSLLIEVGSTEQAEEVRERMKNTGFSSLEIVPDLAKRARVVVGRR